MIVTELLKSVCLCSSILMILSLSSALRPPACKSLIIAQFLFFPILPSFSYSHYRTALYPFLSPPLICCPLPPHSFPRILSDCVRIAELFKWTPRYDNTQLPARPSASLTLSFFLLYLACISSHKALSKLSSNLSSCKSVYLAHISNAGALYVSGISECWFFF